MIGPDLLEILRCPESHQRLVVADLALVADLNTEIAARRLRNRAGKLLETPLEGALVVEDRSMVYPIKGDLPILLIDEGILIRQP